MDNEKIVKLIKGLLESLEDTNIRLEESGASGHSPEVIRNEGKMSAYRNVLYLLKDAQYFESIYKLYERNK